MIESDRINLMLGGDVMLGRGVNSMIHDKGPRFPFESLIPVLRQSDLFFVNLECALTARKLKFSGPFKTFYFRGDPEAVEVLKDAGVDLVSLANNHALDADYSGLTDTLRILRSNEIQYVGAGKSLQEALRPVIIENGGVTFGVLSCCDHQPEFAATATKPGIWFIDTASPQSIEFLLEKVTDLSKKVDHVIVALHWQPNYVPHVKKFHRKLAYRLVEAGARVIWGHSPHHIQGVEWVGNSVVLYSTGGLVDDYSVDAHYHNDRELLYMLQLNKNKIIDVMAYPIELEFCFTEKAGLFARQWIVNFFSKQCEEVGSKVKDEGEWLRISA